jgi:phage recombination protein Bet
MTDLDAYRPPGTAQGTPGLTREQVTLLKDTICKGATDAELDLFVTVCNLRGLNPFTGQIHFVKRSQWNSELNEGKGGYEKVATFQTGIDGYRLIAERTRQYAGPVGTWWCGPDGAWRDVWLEDTPPAAAKVAVRKTGYAEPIVAIARWKAYVQTKQGGGPNRMWARMDAEQLAKCAEALALRKGFPQELSGLYTTDEMAQAGSVPSARLLRDGSVVDGDTGELLAGPSGRQGPPGDGGPSRPPSPGDVHHAQQEGSAQRRRAEASGAGEREPASHAESADGEVAGDARDDPAPDSVPPQPDADFPRAGGAATARVRDLADELHVHIATALKRLSALPGGPVTSATVLSGDALARARKALAEGGDGS